jgi:adenosylmethionine---8-amino-7-oxononanoate aminotransferase
MNNRELTELDLKLNWHPCTPLKDSGQYLPLVIKKAYDSYIELADGRKIIDGIASWWCKSLGHNHPLLKKALLAQLEQFEHVIYANTTYDTIVQLSQKLTTLNPKLKKVFYAGDGSCAVEIALKMSLHTRLIKGQKKRQRFISLKHGYHGETVGALSLSDLTLYRQPYSALLFDPICITPLYVTGQSDPAWDHAEHYWPMVEAQLMPFINTACAIIVEPILQGAGGMRIYSQDFLARLTAWAKMHDIHVIADEIMTGLGRTGKMLACDHANIEPDFLCLGKGLTSGFMPFSAVLTTDAIYQTFYHDLNSAFLHSHTYSGNALGASIALATLDIIEKDKLCQQAYQLQIMMHEAMQEIADETAALTNIRSIGAMVAADLIPANTNQRLAYQVCQKAIALGALLRPLGNTIYWLPPLNIKSDTLAELKAITLQALLSQA